MVGRSKLVLFVGLLATVVFALLFARQVRLSRDLPREAFQQPTLRVLTYASFMSGNGPGKQLLVEFQKICNCKIETVTASEAGVLLERLKLASGVPFDVVLGLDQLMLEEARAQFKWRPQSFDDSRWHAEPARMAEASFVPLDWSPMTFVYRMGAGDLSDSGGTGKLPSPPKKFSDLILTKYHGQFALQDPRVSTPGLQFVNWVRAVVGGEGPSADALAETAAAGTAPVATANSTAANSTKVVEWLQAFKGNVNSVSPSWSFSYNLLQKQKTRFVFSYLTSLAYHWGVDNDRSFQVVQLAEGHPVQVEFVAVPQECRECDLATKFVQFLLEPGAQALIMQKNFMLPVLKGIEQGSVYAELPHLKTIRTPLNKDLHAWDQVFE